MSIWKDELEHNIVVYGCYRKQRYSTRQLARRAQRLVSKSSKVKWKIYPCRECDGFHLTRDKSAQNRAYAEADLERRRQGL